MNKTILKSLKYQVFKSYNQRTPYTLYDIEKRKYTPNQALFNVFDYIVFNSAKNLYEALCAFENINSKKFNSNEDYIDELLNIETYKHIFKKVINVEKINIDEMNFIPVDKQIINEDDITILNLYLQKNDYSNLKPMKNKMFPNIEILIKNIFGGDDEIYNKFINLLSYKLKNPEDLIQCNFVVSDDGGTGKSRFLVAEVLAKLFNVTSISQGDLESQFNSYMVNYQFVVCEEIENFGNNKKIKHLTGTSHLRINKKMIDEFICKNYVSFIIFTNDEKSICIDERDRRFNFTGGGLSLSPNGNQNWKNTYFKSKSENAIFFKNFWKVQNDELKNLYSYLLSLDVERSELQRVVSNKIRTETINRNKQSFKLFIDELISEGFENVAKSLLTNPQSFICDMFLVDKNKKAWFKFKNLYVLYEKFHLDFLKQPHKYLIGKNTFYSKIRSYNLFYELFYDDKTKFYHNDTSQICIKLKTKETSFIKDDITIDEVKL